MNGTPNGTPAGTSGGTAATRTRTRRKAKAGVSYAGWVLDKGAKVLIWYCLATVLFRCPSSQKDLLEGTPKVCKPYLQARDYVTPYATPYYQQYLEPTVQKAQPYVEKLNQQVYQPGQKVYQQYAAPRVEQVQKVGHEQWEKSVKPQLEVARQQAGKQYNAVLGPYVQKVQDVVNPQVQSLKTSASDIWELEVEPVYRRTAPYAQKLLTQGRQFAVDTALPQAQYASSAAWSFWARQIWPKMRVLYGENVEPQLMRITERLGRYRDEKKLEAKVKSIETSSSLTSASSAAAASASSVSSAISEATSGTSSASSVAASSTPVVDLREQFEGDLKNWEIVCAKAVEEGSEDLRERVNEIAARQHKSQVNGTGNALVTQLQETSNGAVSSVKSRILAIVGGLSAEPTDEDIESAETAVTQGVRNAGQTVKSRAQAVREWRTTFNIQTDELVEKALTSTLETIEGIRDIRLTEIARKYSSQEGLSHKDWTKYNELKKAVQVWRDDVKKITEGHAGIAAAKEAASEVESRGMTVAEGAANELARLRDVGKWKIAALDATNDFNSRVVPAAAARASKKIADKITDASEAIAGSSSKTAAPAGAVKSAVVDKASQVSEAVVGSSTGSAESFASKASAAVVGSEQPAVESVSSKIASSASSAASVASEAVVGSSTGSAESIVSVASAAVVGGQQPIIESVSSKVSGSGSSAASIVSSSVIGSSTGFAQSLAMEASSSVSSASSKAAASASSVASEASSAVIGTPSGAADTISDAASSASSAVMGTSTGSAESFASSASSKLSPSSSIDPSAASVLAAGRSSASSASSSGSSIGSAASSSVYSAASEASDH
ncbi:hypothetical protein LTR95_016370, partial [Oleoguttula sp. CCFEE 5521]